MSRVDAPAKRRLRPRRALSAGAMLRIAVAIVASFVAGIVTDRLFVAGGRDDRRESASAAVVDNPKISNEPRMDAARPGAAPAADAARASGVQSAQSPPPDLDDAVDDLRDRKLLVPVQGVTRDLLRDSFKEARDRIREHEAVDILAPWRTPVLAVEDGSIVKFFTSERGGLTIYQFDPSQTYAYYYAHLDGYASGLSEGDHVTRGQTIGYVGTTGNAPENTPHLHFQIFVLTDQKQWWKGTAVNPYDVWKK